MKKIIFFVFVVFILIEGIHALGIGPGKLEFDFEPGMEKEISFFVINSLNVSFPVRVYISGELAQYADFETQDIILEPKEQRKFDFVLKFPSKFERPGEHRADIMAVQTEYIGGSNQGTGVGALVGIKAPIIVRVPYEGPYLEAKISAKDVGVNGSVPFTIEMESFGEEPVEHLNGRIKIFNYKNEEVGSLSFEESLGVKEKKAIVLRWDSEGNNPGIYRADLDIEYSNRKFNSSTMFRLGDYFIDILDYQDSLEAGKIDEYYISLLSTWNEPIGDVYLELSIKYGEDLKSFKSEVFDIDSWENKTINFFVDARNIKKGVYPASLIVFYGNDSNKVDFDIKIVKKSNLWIYFLAVMLVVIVLIMLKRKKGGNHNV
jgi:hypothetical protein